MNSTWQPSASIKNLQHRAKIFQEIRQFFAQRDVMEVDLPVMSHCAVSDPYIDSIEVNYRPYCQAPSQTLYLQTSPEYAMKRLLAAGSGDIYQMSKVFRNGEIGKRHNPEFTMLEWYRLGIDDKQLMAEVSALVKQVLAIDHIEQLSYQQVFEQYLAIDPHQASVAELKAITAQHIEVELEDDDKDVWLNLLISHVIEPKLADHGAVFIYDYPASQAALAQVALNENGVKVAKRFELFVQGLELANGYYELTDAQEQLQRLQNDQQQRASLELPQRPLESRLVDALDAGIPACAGVALGVDRLVMLALNATHIDQVIAFGFDRA